MIMASRGGRVVTSALVIALCLLLQVVVAAEPLVPAMFVFGDSTLDVGNNNYLKNCKTVCKADFPRYGVDYPDHAPTGRFSNGHNLADQLGRSMHAFFRKLVKFYEFVGEAVQYLIRKIDRRVRTQPGCLALTGALRLCCRCRTRTAFRR
jgi:ABC-type transporter Mla maintaining outer membrane lipid asymmetry permease subunit MlaE